MMMKKLFTFLVLFILVGVWNVQAQRAALENVERNLVVVEIGTYLTCGYCPGAARGADDLVEHGKPVAIVENHQGDAYSNVYSHARNSLYGISGYPTAFFDGTLSVVGGSSAATSMYDSYVPKVEARMAVETPIEIDFTYTDNGNNNYTVSADISKVGDYTNDVVMHVFVTESHIPQNWGGLTEVNFVNRLMAPDQNGTALDFSGGNNIVQEVTFDCDASWVRDNCEIIVAVQDMSTKEILNAAKVTLKIAENDYDVAAVDITEPQELICGSEIAPAIVIRNFGGEELTSLDISYSINGGDETVVSWTGSVPFYQYTTIELDPFISPDIVAGENSIEISLGNPNGEADQDESNNTATKVFNAVHTGTEVVMEAMLGSYAEELSWKLFDPQGNIIAEDSYTSSNNNNNITETFTLTETGCHSLVWYDSYGDGFNGGGWCKVYNDGEEFAHITGFGADITTPWFAQIGDVLEGPVDPTANIIDYDISFSWTAPAKATLLGYNIYEQADMSTPINTSLITETTYEYTVPSNGDYAFYFTAVYEEGESDIVGPVEALIAVGLSSLENNSWSFYPNPVKDQLNIKCIAKDASQVKAQIYSISGTQILSMNIPLSNQAEQHIIIPTHELESGVYFVRIEMNGETITQKFTVVK